MVSTFARRDERHDLAVPRNKHMNLRLIVRVCDVLQRKLSQLAVVV